MELGKMYRLRVAREKDFGLYLTDEEEDVLLPKKYIPKQYGEFIEVFVYADSEDRIVSTTIKPKLTLNECAYLTINDVSDYGAFADWGLEKDLLIPFSEQIGKMKKGEKHVIYLYQDERSGRLAGSARIEKFLKEPTTYTEGEAVNLLIGRKTELGFEAVINNKNLGLVYHNEIFQPINTGDSLEGYVKKLRPDGKIDLSLRKIGYDQIKTAEEIILEALKKNNGTLKLTDKSSPEEITQKLNMSKSNFKKAVGALYKQKLITLKEDCIAINQKH